MAPDVRSNVPTRDLVDRFYPGVPFRRDIGAYGSLIANDGAREALGFEPEPELARRGARRATCRPARRADRGRDDPRSVAAGRRTKIAELLDGWEPAGRVLVDGALG